jgi:hypothetical protein
MRPPQRPSPGDLAIHHSNPEEQEWTVSTSSQNPERDAYIAGLRQLADWLEQHPAAPYPDYSTQISLPLMDNAQVEAFALEAGVDVKTDKAGNASATVRFAGLTYYGYGYANWEQHLAQHNESQARNWAADNGMVIEPREDGAR